MSEKETWWKVSSSSESIFVQARNGVEALQKSGLPVPRVAVEVSEDEATMFGAPREEK